MMNSTDNSFTKILKSIKRLIVYQPPVLTNRFVLTEQEKKHLPEPADEIAQSLSELMKLIRYARRLAAAMEEISRTLANARGGEYADSLKRLCRSLDKQLTEINPLLLAYDEAETDAAKLAVSASLAENEAIIGQIYRLPYNADLVIRKFDIAGNTVVPAMLIYVEGLCDKKLVNDLILKPLMLYCRSGANSAGRDVPGDLVKQYLPYSKTQIASAFADVQNSVNTGEAVLFLEGEAAAILIDAKGWEHRSVDRPVFEQTVRGSQTGFGEVLGVNTALVRSLFNSSDLVTEKLSLGIRSKTACVIMYLEAVANPDLVAEVKRRISGVETDAINDVGILEQLIGDHPNLPFPTAINTERPDRVAAGLNEGRVAILLDSCPFALIVPVSLFSLLHSPDDFNSLDPYSSVVRLFRWIGVLFALFIPALFLAISTFHQEAIPTEMLLAITSARLQVPFPTVVEMLLLGVAFELIREGGLRIPGYLGPTIGIVGGIILGQAAVSAKIVSPIMVIVVAATGVASYTIPDFRLGAALRLSSFAFMLLAAVMGLGGIATGILVILAILCNMKSFGMPYISPVAPKTTAGLDVITRGPVYRQELRPDALNTKVRRRQPHISRVWKVQKTTGGESE
jgi:spore germination protein KA